MKIGIIGSNSFLGKNLSSYLKKKIKSKNFHLILSIKKIG